MRTLNLKTPRDFAIVGFDNIQGTWRLPSPLCSVDYSISDMVGSGMALLMKKRIHGVASPPRRPSFLNPRIVCRGGPRPSL